MLIYLKFVLAAPVFKKVMIPVSSMHLFLCLCSTKTQMNTSLLFSALNISQSFILQYFE